MTTSSHHTAHGQGLAIASLTLGIITIVMSAFWFISLVTGILAIVFGAAGLKSAGRRKAIAGLVTGIIGIVITIVIIVSIVLAIPALQKAQRDNLRKSDVSAIMNDIAGYRADNRGMYPTLADLATVSLNRVDRIADSGEPTTEVAVYLAGVSCDDSSANPRSYSVRVVLENGSTYCQDS